MPQKLCEKICNNLIIFLNPGEKDENDPIPDILDNKSTNTSFVHNRGGKLALQRLSITCGEKLFEMFPYLKSVMDRICMKPDKITYNDLSSTDYNTTSRLLILLIPCLHPHLLPQIFDYLAPLLFPICGSISSDSMNFILTDINMDKG